MDKMVMLLRDPLWQFLISIAVGLASLIISLIGLRRGRTKQNSDTQTQFNPTYRKPLYNRKLKRWHKSDSIFATFFSVLPSFIIANGMYVIYSLFSYSVVLLPYSNSLIELLFFIIAYFLFFGGSLITHNINIINPILLFAFVFARILLFLIGFLGFSFTIPLLEVIVVQLTHEYNAIFYIIIYPLSYLLLGVGFISLVLLFDIEVG